jgi:hypothetical protein
MPSACDYDDILVPISTASSCTIYTGPTLPLDGKLSLLS